MKKLALVAIAGVLLAGTAMSAPASAANIGVSMALFDDNFLTVLRNGMIDYSKGMSDVSLQIEDAQNDVGKQLSQVQNFVAAGVDAIIVNPVDTDATVALSQAAAAAGIFAARVGGAARAFAGAPAATAHAVIVIAAATNGRQSNEHAQARKRKEPNLGLRHWGRLHREG